ncbi:hypothetical protein [Erwinia sp. Leaf53]|uniref:hypothetical protein n=1 Tax=Erwinia sp. Leaf53 TaxID=1736225 RepID=UPI0006F27D8C|nr:hypothetical protein [Erwinia sp. Leaf53]KQN53167.1 toluene hydroxylase [Erwinia sp. Leaf53]
MQTKQQIFDQIAQLATACHEHACSIDVGPERTQMFSVYGVLHNLGRNGYAEQVEFAMNPLLSGGDDDDDWDEDDD